MANYETMLILKPELETEAEEELISNFNEVLNRVERSKV